MTTKSKNTPGPWTLGGTSIGAHTVWAGDVSKGINGKGVICIRQSPAFIHSIEEDKANARLIAAAPELVEAAKDLVKKWRDGFAIVTTAEIEKLEAAIARAEGRP